MWAELIEGALRYKRCTMYLWSTSEVVRGRGGEEGRKGGGGGWRGVSIACWGVDCGILRERER